MEIYKRPLKTRLHIDARRSRNLICIYTFSRSIFKIFGIRRPSYAAGDDMEAIRSCLLQRPESGK